MAYTTPFTAVAGTAWKAADWNTYGRDNIAWLATDSPSCRAYNSAAISIANTTATAVTLDSERFDNASMHSTSSNTSRITIPTGGGGKYLFGSGTSWAGSAAGTVRYTYIQLNATTIVAAAVAQFGASSNSQITLTSAYSFAAADYIETIVYQDTGGALNLNSTANFSPEFWASWYRN